MIFLKKKSSFGKRLNKKTIATMYLAPILIGIITFFLILGSLFTMGNDLVGNSEDIICRSYVAANTNEVVKFFTFFYDLNLKCKKDYYSYGLDTKEESLDTVKDAMSRCWYRYGSGKYDFLGNYNTEGDWCFQCAELDFTNSDLNQEISYNEVVDYLKKEKYNETSNYSDYMRLKYVDMNEFKNAQKIQSDVEDLLDSGDIETQEMAMIMGDQMKIINDMSKKSIIPNEKNFVVYRYDRRDKKTMTDAMIGMGIGMAAGLAADVGLAFALKGSLCVGIGLATFGVGGILCGGVMAVFEAGKIAKKANQIAKYANKIKKIIQYLKNTVKFSKKYKVAKKLIAGVETIDDINDVMKKVGPSSPLYDGLKSLSKFATLGNGAKGKGFKTVKGLTKYLDKIEINNVDDISKYQKLIESAIKAEKAFDNVKDIGESAQDITKMKNTLTILKKAKKTKNLEDLKPKEIAQATKTAALVIVGGTTGYVIGDSLNYNENQYVDILTQEQYYRLCGTQAFEKKN